MPHYRKHSVLKYANALKRLTHYTCRGNEKMMNECRIPDLRHLPFGPVRGPSTVACKSQSRLHPRIVRRPLQEQKKRESESCSSGRNKTINRARKELAFRVKVFRFILEERQAHRALRKGSIRASGEKHCGSAETHCGVGRRERGREDDLGGSFKKRIDNSGRGDKQC
ncbi:hypothetical protein NPIL_578691 [Nephila pilipes]|uniref:Uncharacterized protein n=1 Tax=Nephila pilipes TaxID=299642 RepID=A0A8X6QC43_NEPPI|nr:hypothetical protein NPIL_578691 [Nephila pilipes]